MEECCCWCFAFLSLSHTHTHTHTYTHISLWMHSFSQCCSSPIVSHRWCFSLFICIGYHSLGWDWFRFSFFPRLACRPSCVGCFKSHVFAHISRCSVCNKNFAHCSRLLAACMVPSHGSDPLLLSGVKCDLSLANSHFSKHNEPVMKCPTVVHISEMPTSYQLVRWRSWPGRWKELCCVMTFRNNSPV